jgi:site-specific DNA recombinase
MSVASETKRAVGYFRVSTSKQTGERHSSLETQEARFREYCSHHGLDVVATFTDVVTGRRDDRREYQRMVEFALAGGTGFIIVQFLDRFGRNPREILRRYWELQDHGVKVVATDENIEEELILLVRAGLAGAESRRTSERVRANMGRAIAKGVHAARPPYGLRAVHDITDGKVILHWELDPDEGPIVKEMARLFIEENLGYKSIGDRLTAKGYRARGGRPFAAFTVQKILTNPAIAGILVYGRKPRRGNPTAVRIEVPDFFPRILSDDEWHELQKRMSIRREAPRGKANTGVYILSGIARCGLCGGPMSGKAGSIRNGKRYRNYYCSRAMHSREQCNFYNGHSAGKLEKAVLDYLGQFSAPGLVREYLEAADRKEVDKREAQLADAEKQLADSEGGFLRRLDDLLKRNKITESQFDRANQAEQERNARLEASRAELKEWLERERDRTALAEKLPQSVQTFVELFESLEPRQQKAHLQSILKAAYIYNDGRIELEFRE